MSIPAFRAAGTAVFTANSVATPTNLTPTKNVGTVNGDLMLLITESRSITATVGTPTGWTLATGFPVASATASGGKIYVFSRIADGTGNDAPTVTWTGLTTGTTGDSAGARIHSWSGARTVQAGTVPAVTDAAATTNWTSPAITTTGINSLAVAISVKISDTAQTATVATFTERSDDHTTTGTGHLTVVADKVQATASSTGTSTVTPTDTVSARVLAVSVSFAAAPTTVTLGPTTQLGSSRPLVVTKVIRKTASLSTMLNAAQTLSITGTGPPTPPTELRPTPSLGSHGLYKTKPSRNIRTTRRGRSGHR